MVRSGALSLVLIVVILCALAAAEFARRVEIKAVEVRENKEVQLHPAVAQLLLAQRKCQSHLEACGHQAPCCNKSNLRCLTVEIQDGGHTPLHGGGSHCDCEHGKTWNKDREECEDNEDDDDLDSSLGVVLCIVVVAMIFITLTLLVFALLFIKKLRNSEVPEEVVITSPSQVVFPSAPPKYDEVMASGDDKPPPTYDDLTKTGPSGAVIARVPPPSYGSCSSSSGHPSGVTAPPSALVTPAVPNMPIFDHYGLYKSWNKTQSRVPV